MTTWLKRLGLPEIVAVVALVVVLAAAFITMPTRGAWTAQVNNSTNTASSPTTTCRDALMDLSADQNFWFYDFGQPADGGRIYNEVEWASTNTEGSYFTRGSTGTRERAPYYAENYRNYSWFNTGDGACPDEQTGHHWIWDRDDLDYVYWNGSDVDKILPLNFTLETWVKPEPDQSGVILSYTGSATLVTTTAFRVTIDKDGYVWFETYDGTNYNGLSTQLAGITIDDAQWHQVAVSWEQSQPDSPNPYAYMKIYIDGQLVSSDLNVAYRIAHPTNGGKILYGVDLDSNGSWPSRVTRARENGIVGNQFQGGIAYAAAWGEANHDEAIATRWQAFLAQNPDRA